MNRPWLRIAHRGASGSAPEHTHSAFARALELGVDMIELDVQMSRDGELVVIHDLELDRTTDGHGAVRDHDWAALSRFDAGSWFAPRFVGERVLSLREVLVLVGNRARVNIEIKSPTADWQSTATRLISLVREHEVLASSVISCFEPEALRLVRQCAPDANIGLLWHQPDFSDAWRWVRTLGAVSIHPYWRLVSEGIVRTASEHGVQVLAWTVNETEAMRRLLQLGIDGIISDFPERFRELSGTITMA